MGKTCGKVPRACGIGGSSGVLIVRASGASNHDLQLMWCLNPLDRMPTWLVDLGDGHKLLERSC